jgi:hypothetical protein
MSWPRPRPNSARRRCVANNTAASRTAGRHHRATRIAVGGSRGERGQPPSVAASAGWEGAAQKPLANVTKNTLYEYVGRTQNIVTSLGISRWLHMYEEWNYLKSKGGRQGRVKAVLASNVGKSGTSNLIVTDHRQIPVNGRIRLLLIGPTAYRNAEAKPSRFVMTRMAPVYFVGRIDNKAAIDTQCNSRESHTCRHQTYRQYTTTALMADYYRRRHVIIF